MAWRPKLRAAGAVLPLMALGLALTLGNAPSVRASDEMAAAPDGEALYKARCAGCHDNAQERTPTREVLAKNPPPFIVGALNNGAMAPMAEGLSAAEKTAIAAFITGAKLPPPSGDIDPHAIWGPSAAHLPLDAPKCETPAPPIDLKAPAWNGWSPTPRNARYQPDPGLKASDVPRLKLKWAFNYPGSKNGQATIVGDWLFTTSMSGAVYALDTRTGCVRWRHVAEAATRSSVTVIPMNDGRHALFFSDWTKSAVALDAATGELLWKTKIDDSHGLQMTGAPTVYDGKLFVPISSGVEAFAEYDGWECCKFRGSLVALDVATGKVLWKTYTTDVEPKIFGVNRLGRPMWGPAGGAIWSAPTIDAARGLVYVGTSNSYTDAPHDGSDAVIAMDIETGKVRWRNQLLADDNYINGCWLGNGRTQPAANCPERLGPDFSIGNSPILQDLPDGRQLLVVGQKSGHVYALDPANEGRVVWSQRIGPGSALGGVEFGLATDGKRVYVGISDVIAGPEGKPGVYALRITDGKLLWSAPSPANPTCRWKNRWCHGAVSQAVSAMPGVVFVGAYDGIFRAYDAATGKVIWSFDTGSNPIDVLGGRQAYGGVMDGGGATIAGGMVFVHTGYAGRSGESAGRDLTGAEGNVLLAFSTDGK